MTKSFATLAAVLLLASPASAAFAQSIGADASGPRIEAPVVQVRSLFGVPSRVFANENDDAAVDTDVPATTGSTAPRRTVRGIDGSAEGGNAAPQDRLVPQYGNTSGGPAE